MAEEEETGAPRGKRKAREAALEFGGADARCDLSAAALLELVEAGSDWLWETDAELRFSWLSDSYRAATGIDPSTVLGRFRFDFLKQVLKGSRNAAAHLEDLQAHRPFREFVYELKGGRPECRWVSTTGFPRFDADGAFVGYRGIGRNVTGLAGSFEELEKASRDGVSPADRGHAERMMTALNIMSDAFCYYDENDVLVLHNEAMTAMYAGLADVIRPGVTFATLIDTGLDRGFWDTQGLAAAEWRKAILDKRRDEVASSAMIKFADGRCIMHREMRAEEGGTISICTDVTELESRQAELLAAGERSRQLLFDLERTIDSMEMGIVILDADLKAEIVNRAFYDIWKVTPEQVGIGNPFRALMDINRHAGIYQVADDKWEAYVASRLAEIRAGDVAPREFKRADGCTMIYSVTALSGGKRLISYFDVTEMKNREAELAEALEKSRLAEAVINGVKDPIFVKDDRLKFVFVNEAFSSLYGVAPQAMLGKAGGDFLTREEAAFFEESERQVLSTGQPYEAEETFE